MPATAGATTTAVATSTALRSSANPSAAGASVIYTATVSPAPNGNSVSFSDNGAAPPGCAAVAVSTSTGQATCSVSYASAGAHTVTAAYSGDATFSASASVPLNQVVSEASFPTAGTSYPNGAIVGFAGADYVLAGGRAFGAGTPAVLRAVQKVDPAKAVAAPAGATAPAGVTPRPGTLVSTRAVDANPTVYVVGTRGDLYGFAGPAQFVGAGFDPALVVTVPSLGGLKVSATSAGAAGLTAFSTSADGAIVDSGGAYYVFAGAKAFRVPSRRPWSRCKRPTRAKRPARVTSAETAAPIASGALLSVAGGNGVFVSYNGDAYPFKTMAQVLRDGYGGTAAVPVPGTGALTVLSHYSGL